MDVSNPVRAICLAAAISIALAAPAFGAPAGDEYLPKVPKASGGSQAGSQSQGPNASASGSGTAAAQPQAPAESGGNGSPNSTGRGQKKSAGAPPATGSTSPASSSDNSSDSTLLSPIVLMLIAGVIIAAVGMTLRRRKTDGPELSDESGSDRPEPANVPRTPDGEIVTGGDGAR